MSVSVRAAYFAYQRLKKREIRTYSTTKFIELIISLLPVLKNDELLILYAETQSKKIRNAIEKILAERSHMPRS